MQGTSGLRSHLKQWALLPFTCACLLLMAAPGRAQTAPPEEATGAKEPNSPQTGHRHERRLYLGMWTTHLKQNVLVLDNNWVIGATAGGFFCATFLNSYGHRAFTGGLQRTIVSTDGHPVSVSLGYRLGFLTGYDGRLMPLAGETPVLPLVQPFVTVDVAHVGVEVSYTFVVMSFAVSYKF